jgi:hypothetical protein
VYNEVFMQFSCQILPKSPTKVFLFLGFPHFPHFSSTCKRYSKIAQGAAMSLLKRAKVEKSKEYDTSLAYIVQN